MSGKAQAEIWERPTAPADPRPLETGGALVIIRLTPAEVTALGPYGFPLVEAIHRLISDSPPMTPSTPPSARSERV